MALPKVEGTKVRGGIYQLNLRVPAEASHLYDGKTHLRRSLKTADPREATRQVTVAQAKLIEAVCRARQRDTLAEAVAALPPDQRELYEDAGGLSELIQRYGATDTARTFLRAGGALTERELDGEEASAVERLQADAAHRAEIAALDQIARTEAKALRALGEDVPTVEGLMAICRLKS
ncbi:hypothetical protein KO516_05030 [Citreicella sp. C3M06]|uniref:DUF6538 domain-containing protein n=1 Tax=Citreicella sp. C3M06 TaxID=2841564 RepID=UPI001C09107D|nr:DUF6538 domain-containing protein [Citreicella sp. C3M06]MBU2960204.1 hypothetical protein [Citreicella sp. C3M06]